MLVMDNLNTHDIGFFYEAFDQEEAHRLAQRFEIHFPPKHGSWLNISEIELSVLKRQCLNGRIDELSKVQSEVKAWTEQRNCEVHNVNWQFSTTDARIKLKLLYPEVK